MLLLLLGDGVSTTVGRLGMCTFDPGAYAYAGSAVRGLDHRLARHARRGKRVHWHVDRLTRLPQCHVRGAVMFPATGPTECEAVGLLARLPTARVTPVGFGASDHRCGGHLVHLGEGGAALDMALELLLAPPVEGTWLSIDDIGRPGSPRRRRR